MTNNTVISREIAAAEFGAWLDFKRVKANKRTEKEREIESLISCIEDGSLVVDPETKELKYKLIFPIQNDKGVETIKELTFQPRILTSRVQQAMANVNATDTLGFINAYLQALTGHPKSIFSAMDIDDHNIIKNIAFFFM